VTDDESDSAPSDGVTGEVVPVDLEAGDTEEGVARDDLARVIGDARHDGIRRHRDVMVHVFKEL
jgi:hypothetical protein